MVAKKVCIEGDERIHSKGMGMMVMMICCQRRKAAERRRQNNRPTRLLEQQQRRVYGVCDVTVQWCSTFERHREERTCTTTECVPWLLCSNPGRYIWLRLYIYHLRDIEERKVHQEGSRLCRCCYIAMVMRLARSAPTIQPAIAHHRIVLAEHRLEPRKWRQSFDLPNATGQPIDLQ